MLASLLFKMRAEFERETFRLRLLCTDVVVYKLWFGFVILPRRSAL